MKLEVGFYVGVKRGWPTEDSHRRPRTKVVSMRDPVEDDNRWPRTKVETEVGIWDRLTTSPTRVDGEIVLGGVRW